MLVNNKKIQLDKAKENTIILSEIKENFIILDDNTYPDKKNINRIGKEISKYDYKVKILSINNLVEKVRNYLYLKNINLKDYTIVTVGEGGKQVFKALNKEALEVIEIKWSRNWKSEISNEFITNIEAFNFKSKNIILIEDVIATGETLYNIIFEINRKGGNIKKIICAIINESSPLIDKSFAETIVAAKIISKDSENPFWYPAIYSTRHLFYGDEEMPKFYEVLNDKYFKEDKIEKEIKKMRSE
jgi:uracil phosphoribosyltransferase